MSNFSSLGAAQMVQMVLSGMRAGLCPPDTVPINAYPEPSANPSKLDPPIGADLLVVGVCGHVK